MTHTRTARWVSFFLACMLFLSVVVTSALAAYATIPFGEQSDNVRALQNALKKKGYYRGSVDGKFGQATRSAVYRYQVSLGIKADGKPGNLTLTALYNGGSSAINTLTGDKLNAPAPKNPRSLYHGCTGPRVVSLQRALRAAGFYKGSNDGVYGELTEAAVRRFQAKRGLHVDGIAGTRTVASLNRAQKKIKLRGAFLMSVGSRGSTVKTAQVMLQNKENLSVTDTIGIYGTSTTTAVRQWQDRHGYEVTGNLTETQYNALLFQK